MRLLQSIVAFYRSRLLPADKIIFLLMLIMCLESACFQIVNALTKQYAFGGFYRASYLLGIPPVVGLYSLTLFARDLSPKVSLTIQTYTMLYFIAVVVTLVATSCQLSPFPTIDHLLVNIDQWMHFDQVALLTWTHQHPHIKHILDIAYDSIDWSLLLLPFVLSMYDDRHGISQYFTALIASFIIGTLIYYFFPTTAPASQFHSAYFSASEHDTFLKFYQLHHHLPVTTEDGGLIAFPSFHVIWAILITLPFWRHIKTLLIIAPINLMVIASTMCLGWHYLTDVIGGFIIAFFTWTLAGHCLKKNETRDDLAPSNTDTDSH